MSLLYFVFLVSNGTKSLSTLEANIAKSVVSRIYPSDAREVVDSPAVVPLDVKKEEAEEEAEEAGGKIGAVATARKPRVRTGSSAGKATAGSAAGLHLATQQHARYGEHESITQPAPLAEIERNMTFYLHTLHARLHAMAGPHVDAVDVWEEYLHTTKSLFMVWDEQNEHRFPNARSDNSIFVSLGTYRLPPTSSTVFTGGGGAKRERNQFHISQHCPESGAGVCHHCVIMHPHHRSITPRCHCLRKKMRATAVRSPSA